MIRAVCEVWHIQGYKTTVLKDFLGVARNFCTETGSDFMCLPALSQTFFLKTKC